MAPETPLNEAADRVIEGLARLLVFTREPGEDPRFRRPSYAI